MSSFHANILQEWLEDFPGLCTHAYFGFGKNTEQHHSFWHDKKTGPVLGAGTPAENLQFDIASLTKAFVTTSLVLKYLKPHLSDNLHKLIGNETISSLFGDDFKAFLKSISVSDLLKHKSGLPAWRNFWIKQIDEDGNAKLQSREQISSHMDEVLGRAIISATTVSKKKYNYSDLGFLLLQRVLEEKKGESFDLLWQQYCQDHPEFEVIKPTPPIELCAPTARCKLRNQNVAGVVHDENAFSLGGLCGHAGGFSDGPGLLNLVQQIAQRKDELRLLDFVTLDGVAQGQLNGWQASTSAASEAFGHGKAIGHLGFTGTCFWIEPASGTYFILLTNRTFMQRLDSRIQKLRKKAGAFAWNFFHAGH